VNAATALRAGLALAALQPCCLCGDPRLAATAMYVPAEGRRVFFYALCVSCFEREDAPELVEAGLRDAA
jgi:hypothetical protein